MILFSEDKHFKLISIVVNVILFSSTLAAFTLTYFNSPLPMSIEYQLNYERSFQDIPLEDTYFNIKNTEEKLMIAEQLIQELDTDHLKRFMYIIFSIEDAVDIGNYQYAEKYATQLIEEADQLAEYFYSDNIFAASIHDSKRYFLHKAHIILGIIDFQDSHLEEAKQHFEQSLYFINETPQEYNREKGRSYGFIYSFRLAQSLLESGETTAVKLYLNSVETIFNVNNDCIQLTLKAIDLGEVPDLIQCIRCNPKYKDCPHKSVTS